MSLEERIKALGEAMTRPSEGVRHEHAGGGLFIPHTVRQFWEWKGGKCFKRYRDIHTGQVFREGERDLVAVMEELNR